MRRQGIASLLFALATAVSVIGQTPSAQDEAMPLLRDVSRIALRNVRIVDGTGALARQNQTLIIERGQIRAIGNAADINVPEGTRTLDLDGRTVLPGFVMLHEHMFDGTAEAITIPQPFTSPRLYLAFGVTTIRTAGTDHPYVDVVRFRHTLYPAVPEVATMLDSNRATYAYIVVLSNPTPTSESILSLGQSGFIAPDGTLDAHFRDQLERYRNFEYKAMRLFVNAP